MSHGASSCVHCWAYTYLVGTKINMMCRHTEQDDVIVCNKLNYYKL